jgi:hypothetical protein
VDEIFKDVAACSVSTDSLAPIYPIHSREGKEQMKTIYLERLSGGIFNRCKRPPTYVAPHRAHGWKPLTNEREWDEPESVMARGIHRPVRGRLNDLREMPEAEAVELEELELQESVLLRKLAAIRVEKDQLIRSAFLKSRVLTIKEVKAWKEAAKQPETAQ